MKAHDDTMARLRAANLAPSSSVAARVGNDEIRQARARIAELASDVDPQAGELTPAIKRKRGDVVLGALAVLALASLTPPVQALADRVGELVGIGDEPTRNVTGPIDEPAIVIGSGHSPTGTPYEVVASADANIYYDENPPTCIGLDLPSSGGPSSAGCLTADLQELLAEKTISPIAFLGPNELGASQLIVDGLASTDVDRVEIEHRTETGVERYTAEVSTLNEELASDVGASDQASFFLAFLPTDLVPPFDPKRPVEPFVLPAPAPGATSGQGPVIGRDDLPVPPDFEVDSPVERALAQLTAVAYDSQGVEIGRVPLLRGPFTEARLYSQLRRPDQSRSEQMLDTCYEQTLRRYGELGEIKPQLPHEFGQELGQCLQEQPVPAP